MWILMLQSKYWTHIHISPTPEKKWKYNVADMEITYVLQENVLLA